MLISPLKTSISHKPSYGATPPAKTAFLEHGDYRIDLRHLPGWRLVETGSIVNKGFVLTFHPVRSTPSKQEIKVTYNPGILTVVPLEDYISSQKVVFENDKYTVFNGRSDKGNFLVAQKEEPPDTIIYWPHEKDRDGYNVTYQIKKFIDEKEVAKVLPVLRTIEVSKKPAA